MHLVEVAALHYRYPDGTPALSGVDLCLDEGECVGLIGPNGAGKSTLLWHLNGLLPEKLSRQHSHALDKRPRDKGRAGEGGAEKKPHASLVRIAGLDVTPEHLPAIRRAVGLVFQDPDDQLFCPTIGEDVSFGPRHLNLSDAEIDSRVRSALSAVGLEGYEERLAHHLSVGERKRACLAGVLACRPRLLALDEPTANLDPRARRQLLSILRELDCARLIACHDLELVLELCQRVVLIDGGKVHADGPPSEVLGDERLMTEHGLEVPLGLIVGRDVTEGGRAGQGRGWLTET